MAKQKLTIKALAAKLAKEAPPAWGVTTGAGYHDGSQAWPDHPTRSDRWVLLAREGVVIALNISRPTDEWAREHSYEGLLVEGHTCFDGRCFTRRGVDTSSCRLTSAAALWDNDYRDLAALLDGEYARCAAARERAKTAVQVPGLPFNVQPSWFATAAETLRSGRIVRLAPGGFGTGFSLSTRRFSNYSKRAAAALETKLGVGAVYVETFDHD